MATSAFNMQPLNNNITAGALQFGGAQPNQQALYQSAFAPMNFQTTPNSLNLTGSDFNFGSGLGGQKQKQGTSPGWMGYANFGLSALGTLGGLYNAYQGNKLARDQLNHVRNMDNTNLANQIRSYNRTLESRSREAGRLRGDTDEQINQYIEENKMTR